MKNIILKSSLLTLVLFVTGVLITVTFHAVLEDTEISLYKDFIRLIALSSSLLVVLMLTKSLPLLWQFYAQKTVIKSNHIYVLVAIIGMNLLLHYIMSDSDLVEEVSSISMLQMFLIIPVLEELVFRGVFQARLSLKYHWRMSILVSSILFMLIHYDSINIMVLALIFSSLVGYLYHRTSSLLLCVLCHSIVNIGIYFMAIN